MLRPAPSPPNLLFPSLSKRINASSGEAVALATGHARILYNGTVQTYIEVTY